MVLISVAGFGAFAFLPPFWALSTRYMAGAGAVGAATAVGAINSIGNLAGFVSPYAIGYIKDATNSYEGGLITIAAVSYIGVACTAYPRRIWREGQIGAARLLLSPR